MRLWTIAIVPLIVWLSVFVYLWTIDRKLAQLEGRAKQEEDDLL